MSVLSVPPLVRGGWASPLCDAVLGATKEMGPIRGELVMMVVRKEDAGPTGDRKILICC